MDLTPTPTSLTPTVPPGLFPIDFGTLVRAWQHSSVAQIFPQIPDISTFFDVDAIVAKIKLVSFFISVVFSFLFMVVLMKLRGLYAAQAVLAQQSASLISSSGIPTAVKGPYRARWEEILEHMDSAKEAEWKFAIIEADNLADLVLKRAGFQGDSMGDRMMSIQDGQLITVQDLWEAHKVRNNIAHNAEYFLRYSEAKQAIQKYEKFLLELGGV